jgi:hypothetical protein
MEGGIGAQGWHRKMLIYFSLSNALPACQKAMARRDS